MKNLFKQSKLIFNLKVRENIITFAKTKLTKFFNLYHDDLKIFILIKYSQWLLGFLIKIKTLFKFNMFLPLYDF